MTHATSTDETTTMAKTQKTLVLNEEVCQLIQAFADTLGTSFSRVVTAAVLDYFFEPISMRPSEGWMNLAVRLEKGETTLPGVPVLHYETWVEGMEALRRRQEADGQPDAALRATDDSIKTLTYRGITWRRTIESEGGGIAGLIAVSATNILLRGPSMPLSLKPNETSDDQSK